MDSTHNKFGKFTNKLKLEKISADSNEYKPIFILKLKDDFFYKDSYGHTWKAYSGDIIDGSSIPLVIWELYGSLLSSNFVNAVVIFETACNRREHTWEITHEMFYEAMLTCKVDEINAKIIYAGVYYFGQHWPSRFEADKIYFNILKQSMFRVDDFYNLKHLIETENISLREIVEYEPAHIYNMAKEHS